MESTDTNETAARLRRSINQLHRRLRHSALGGISPAQASMLGSIEKLKSPSLGELAIEEQIQPPSVTRLAQSLVALDLIALREDPADRRCTRVSLTPEGRRELMAIRRRKTEFLETKLRALPVIERARANELASLLEHLLDQS